MEERVAEVALTVGYRNHLSDEPRTWSTDFLLGGLAVLRSDGVELQREGFLGKEVMPRDPSLLVQVPYFAYSFDASYDRSALEFQPSAGMALSFMTEDGLYSVECHSFDLPDFVLEIEPAAFEAPPDADGLWILDLGMPDPETVLFELLWNADEEAVEGMLYNDSGACAALARLLEDGEVFDLREWAPS